jgi:predicted metal-binding protein
MSYCPECCSEEFDDLKRGNKRFFVCEMCGAEWVEDDAAPKTCQHVEKPAVQLASQINELYRRRRD